MKITVVSFQRHRRSELHQAEQEYIKRLERYADVRLVSVPRWDEAITLPANLLNSTWRIGMYVEGKAWTSVGMARRIQQLLNLGQSHLIWVIGAAEGMPGKVGEQLDERWSLSSLTFGHQLTRLILLEALYRSFDILHGRRYHK